MSLIKEFDEGNHHFAPGLEYQTAASPIPANLFRVRRLIIDT